MSTHDIYFCEEIRQSIADVLQMGTCNICFLWRNMKNIHKNIFGGDSIQLVMVVKKTTLFVSMLWRKCIPSKMNIMNRQIENQGPVVQSIVSLTSSLRVISLTVLADSIYNILIFFAEKMWVAFALQKLLTFFQQKLSAYLHIIRCKF